MTRKKDVDKDIHVLFKIFRRNNFEVKKSRIYGQHLYNDQHTLKIVDILKERIWFADIFGLFSCLWISISGKFWWMAAFPLASKTAKGLIASLSFLLVCLSPDTLVALTTLKFTQVWRWREHAVHPTHSPYLIIASLKQFMRAWPVFLVPGEEETSTRNWAGVRELQPGASLASVEVRWLF